MKATMALAFADLAVLLITAGFGYASLRQWTRRESSGFPRAKFVTHVTFQIIGITVWVVFAITGWVAAAWAAFVILTAGQVFGDLLMFASYRARHPDATRPNYVTVGGDVLSFRRPRAGFHAIIGAVGWFGMLGISIYATVQGAA